MEIKFIDSSISDSGIDEVEIKLDEEVIIAAENYSKFYAELHKLIDKYEV